MWGRGGRGRGWAWPSGVEGGADLAVDQRQFVDLVGELRVERLEHFALRLVGQTRVVQLAARRLAGRLQPRVPLLQILLVAP